MKTLEEKLREGLIAPGTPIPLLQTIEFGVSVETANSLQESFNEITLTESEGNGAKKLVVTVEGIHTGMTKNKTFYPGSTLESSVDSWTTPHHKPVLTDHNTSRDAIGRIIEAAYAESTLTDKYTVRLKLEVTDEEAIKKVLDRRYLTLSVGGSANRVNCSVCGVDLVKEGYCGHRRGRTYDSKEAYWTIGEYTGDEISFVNVPADVHAQVIAIELVTDKGGKQVSADKNTESNETPTEPTKTTESAGNVDAPGMIDDILNIDESAVNTDNIDENEENPSTQTENTQTDGGSDDNDPSQTKEGDNSGDDDVETLKAKIATLESQLEAANQTITEKDVENTALTGNLAESEEKATRLSEELESAEKERKKLSEQNVTLATYSRRVLTERVADLRLLNSGEELDRNAIIAEFKNSSSKVLESQIKDLLSKTPVRQQAQVENPGLGIDESKAPIVDENGDPINESNQYDDEEEALPTLKNFEEKMYASSSRY